MDEVKWIVVAFMVFVVGLFGGLFFSEYLTHKRDMACIEKGGTPANKTCLYGLRMEQP